VPGQETWNFGVNPKIKRNPATQDEHHHLFGAIRSGADYNEAEYGAMSTMTAILGRLATYSGRTVTFSDALNSPIKLGPDVYDFKALPPVLPDADGLYAAAIPGITKVV
jgi:hypothetical protein